MLISAFSKDRENFWTIRNSKVVNVYSLSLLLDLAACVFYCSIQMYNYKSICNTFEVIAFHNFAYQSGIKILKKSNFKYLEKFYFYFYEN